MSNTSAAKQLINLFVYSQISSLIVVAAVVIINISSLNGMRYWNDKATSVVLSRGKGL